MTAEEELQKIVDTLHEEYDVHIPTCPHCNGLLTQIPDSPIHLAVGASTLQCLECKRKYELKRVVY